VRADPIVRESRAAGGTLDAQEVKKEASMLVLSRQRDESIIIGDNIVVTIVDIRGDKVRLGINAPSEIPVHRREIHEAILRENQRAASLETSQPKQT
jgi:carbon storage regulator